MRRRARLETLEITHDAERAALNIATPESHRRILALLTRRHLSLA
jgi:hypothetical protein